MTYFYSPNFFTYVQFMTHKQEIMLQNSSQILKTLISNFFSLRSYNTAIKYICYQVSNHYPFT